MVQGFRVPKPESLNPRPEPGRKKGEFKAFQLHSKRWLFGDEGLGLHV